jgi:hypothetical protein
MQKIGASFRANEVGGLLRQLVRLLDGHSGERQAPLHFAILSS